MGGLTCSFALKLLSIVMCALLSSTAASGICSTANFTVMDAYQDRSGLVTVSPSTPVTLACWIWCGYVDWSLIQTSRYSLQTRGLAQYSCNSQGNCQPVRGFRRCDGVQPGQGHVRKFELEVIAKETFYIECRPQCPFSSGKEVTRTAGLLVHVKAPPTTPPPTTDPPTTTPLTKTPPTTIAPLTTEPTVATTISYTASTTEHKATEETVEDEGSTDDHEGSVDQASPVMVPCSSVSAGFPVADNAPIGPVAQALHQTVPATNSATGVISSKQTSFLILSNVLLALVSVALVCVIFVLLKHIHRTQTRHCVADKQLHFMTTEYTPHTAS